MHPAAMQYVSQIGNLEVKEKKKGGKKKAKKIEQAQIAWLFPCLTRLSPPRSKQPSCIIPDIPCSSGSERPSSQPPAPAAVVAPPPLGEFLHKVDGG